MIPIIRKFPLKGALERPDLEAVSRVCGKADLMYFPTEKELWVKVDQAVGERAAKEYVKTVQKYLKRKDLYITWTS